MDNTKGQFEPISQLEFEKQMQKSEPLVFKQGEILEVRGSRFRVITIKRNKLILKLLPKID
jgi:hypothetical protein